MRRLIDDEDMRIIQSFLVIILTIMVVALMVALTMGLAVRVFIEVGGV
jgi:flagellar biosynthesis protein FliQ